MLQEDFKYATLSRVRKFKVDGQVIQSTTKKIVDVQANRTIRDNKKYQQMRFVHWPAVYVDMGKYVLCVC